jgi:hypothetical protein
MYSQFSLVRFSSVAFTTASSKALACARNMLAEPGLGSALVVYWV